MSSSNHPNVKVIEGMTAAAVNGDKDALAKIFTDDLQFHVRGPLPKVGDHDGVDGFTDVDQHDLRGLTDGDVKIEAAADQCRRHVGHRVGARRARPQRPHPRHPQRVRLPLREQPHRRDVDGVHGPAGSEAFWA